MAIECKTEFDFTLLLDGIDQLSSEMEDSLFAAGCDDATISMPSGWAYLTFCRAAASLKLEPPVQPSPSRAATSSNRGSSA